MRTLSILALLAACTPPTTIPTTTTPPPLAGGAGPTSAAPTTNLSIQAARRLIGGEVVDFTLPCGGEKVYFGPFEFAAENQRVDLVAAASSTTGEQVCGGGEWIDAQGAFLAVSGLGCVEGRNPYTSHITNDYTPAAGGTAATPQFLTFQRTADPAGAGCTTVAVHLQVKEVPGTAGHDTVTAGATLDPRLQHAAEAAQRDRVLKLLTPAIPDGGARTAMIAIHDAARATDDVYAKGGTTRAALEQAMTALQGELAAAPDEAAKRKLVDAFSAKWAATFGKLRVAAGVTTGVRSGDAVSIRDCVRDQGSKAPAAAGSKVAIRDCVHDGDVLYRALSLSSSAVETARPTTNGVIDLAKLRPKASALAARTGAPPFDDTASQRNGGWLDHAAFATVRGEVKLPLMQVLAAGDQHAHATFFKQFSTGAKPQVVLVQIAQSGPFMIAGLGYATVGHAAQLEVHANGATVCSDQRQDGRYGAVFSIEVGSLSAPRFLECTIPANSQGEIAVSISSWAVAGGFATASLGASGNIGTVSFGFSDAPAASGL
ncbi:MAG: hypothetical protein IPQ07_29475 [Myxococcales bacterium]|nr:hypothetical protein [Myxococcales bacterium]